MVKSVKDETKKELDKIHKDLELIQDKLRRSYQVDGLSSRQQVAEAKAYFRIVKDKKLRCEAQKLSFKARAWNFSTVLRFLTNSPGKTHDVLS